MDGSFVLHRGPCVRATRSEDTHHLGRFLSPDEARLVARLVMGPTVFCLFCVAAEAEARAGEALGPGW